MFSLKPKKNLIAIYLLLACLIASASCTNSIQRQLASTDILKNAENEMVNGEYRYIINKRSGKVHTYTHGIQIIENKDNILATNDDLETILQDENKDLCRTCWAGIKTNLKSYDDNSLDLIEKFMRLYDFSEIDIETQKFLMCIFEVGEWYVDNVYTYQGGKQTVIETETIAKASASESAYKRWQNYLSTYSSFHIFRDDSKILPVVYDNHNNPTTLVTYKCDLFEKNNYPKGNIYNIKNSDNINIYEDIHKNNCVIDDCSKFAATVYYYYLNKELKDSSNASKIDLWYTNSKAFTGKSNLISILTGTNKFKYLSWNDIASISKEDKDYLNFDSLDLEVGDLIYKEGHVEFYIGNNKVIGWGRIHKTYTLNKMFHPEIDGFHTNDPKDDNIPYTSFIRLKRR